MRTRAWESPLHLVEEGSKRNLVLPRARMHPPQARPRRQVAARVVLLPSLQPPLAPGAYPHDGAWVSASETGKAGFGRRQRRQKNQDSGKAPRLTMVLGYGPGSKGQYRLGLSSDASVLSTGSLYLKKLHNKV